LDIDRVNHGLLAPGQAAKAEEKRKAVQNICRANCCRSDFRARRKATSAKAGGLEVEWIAIDALEV
jgi:hypothetical protein